MLRLSVTTLLLLASLFTVCAAEADSTEKVNYIPQVHGVARARFEYSTEHGESRFQVRNARLNVSGKIASWADYYVQADFCDRGKIKMLDAWARIWATKELGFQAGQFRMPFGVDPFRSPATYIFANRSFVGKQMCNVRAVGLKAIWQPASLPLSIEAGAFNPGTISDHTPWHNTLTFASKLTLRHRNVTFTTGFQSVRPDGIRANLIDGAVGWRSGRWTVEGEYMWKHYTRDRFRDAHAYLVWADYAMPLTKGIFNRLSFQGRFDGLTAHSSAVPGTDGRLITDDPARNRLTVGATISYIRTKSMGLDLRLNYESYFYHSTYRPDADGGNKLTAEIVIRF